MNMEEMVMAVCQSRTARWTDRRRFERGVPVSIASCPNSKIPRHMARQGEQKEDYSVNCSL